MGTAPFIQNEDPAASDTGVARTKVLNFDLVDDDDDIVLSTVRVYVDEGQGAGQQLAYDGSIDSFIAPYNGASSQRPSIPYGYRFAINKTSDWPLLSLMQERVVAEDAEANPLDTSWSFTTESEWTLKDQVNFNQYNITDVDDDPTGKVIALGTDLSQDNNRIVETFDYGEDWTVHTPSYNGPMPYSFSGSWHSVSWTSLDEEPPVIDQQDPANGEVGVSRNTKISFRATDSYGILSSATQIYVNGLKVWENDGPLMGWSGVYLSITDGYRYTLTNPGVFSYGSTVTVRAIVEDNSGITAEETWSFTIEVEEEVGIRQDFKYLETVDFPFRFLPDCDVVLTSDDKAVNDSIVLSTFIRRNGFPLVPLGFGVEESVFDNIDEGFKAFIALRLQEAILLGVSGVQPSQDMTFIEDENKVSIVVPYANSKIRKIRDTILAIPKEPTD